MKKPLKCPEAGPVQEWVPPEPFDFDAWKAADSDAYLTVRMINQLNTLASIQPGRYRFALLQMSLLPVHAYSTRDVSWHWYRYLSDAWRRAVSQSPEAAAIHALAELIIEVKTRPTREKQEKRIARRKEKLAKAWAKAAPVFDATDAVFDSVMATAEQLANKEERRRCTG